MVRYTLFGSDKALLENFSKYSTIYGIVFILIGLVGIIYPVVISLASALFYGWLLLFGGLVIGMHTWQTNRKDWMGWLKTFMFLLVGALVLINPVAGVAALGMLLAMYFFMDGFVSFSLAFELRPKSMWWLSLINAVISLFLGLYVVISWPISSLFLVGFFVGISLFFDGVLLLGLGKSAKDMGKAL